MKDRLLVAWLREDEWGITSYLDLVVQIVESLHAVEPSADRANEFNKIFSDNAVSAEKTAVDLLSQFVGNRRLLIIVENLDEVFASIGEVGQQKLRSFLQEKEYPLLLATAPSL